MTRSCFWSKIMIILCASHKRFKVGHIPEPLYYFRRHNDALFCSRFCEVKAADVLVRYKNGFLNADGLLDGVIACVMRNIGGLTNPILRWSHGAVRRVSFRLTIMNERWIMRYLKIRLCAPVNVILRDYESARLTFGQARDALKNLMLAVGKVNIGSEGQFLPLRALPIA